MPKFKKLGLSDEVLKVLKELGFIEPTDIQEQAIPQLLEGTDDFIGVAQTGTGKTAAFGLPLLELIDPNERATQALILAPTRELGQQIAEQLQTFSKYMHRVNVLAVYGGAAISNQIKALRQKPQHIIVATPGRLIDLRKRKAVKLHEIDYLVLDEADEMLNMGFKEELDEILSYTPDTKLTWLFSATMPSEIRRIVKKYMDDPIEVRVNASARVNINIEHQFAVVRLSDRTEALTRFLDINPDMHGLVFCRTRRDTQRLAEDLMRRNYRVDAIHGDLSQAQRDRVMRRFKAHDLNVLIATDVAARGIDVTDITYVFHFALPDDNAYYTHRSGRTARAGKEGISLAFIDGREMHKINRLQKKLGITFNKVLIPGAEEIAEMRVESWCIGILNTPAGGKINPDLLDKASILYGNLSKEELIAKFLVHELNQLNFGSSKNLNEPSRDRNFAKADGKRKSAHREKKHEKSRGGAKHKKDRRSNGKNENPRFFINIGKRDNVNRRHLIDFICETAHIKKSDIGEVDLQKSYSFFEVNPKVGKKITHKFKDMVLHDGRALRVNRDN